MKFFFDNNLSPRLAKALDALEGTHGHDVVHLKQRFKPNIPDEEWLITLGNERGWAVITSDFRITKNPHEVAAWRESGLTVFFLRTSWFKIQFWDQAHQLVKRWPQLVEMAERHPVQKRYLVPIKGMKLLEI